MDNLKTHNAYLREVILSSNLTDDRQPIDLDRLDATMRDHFSIEDMRVAGSFFTGEALAQQTLTSFCEPISQNSIILDPTCGAGNLLIACSRQLDIKNTLSETLKVWGKILWGYDIYPFFVEASKLRIITDILSRGAINDCCIETAISLLDNIKVKDALTLTKEELSSVTHAIINPPFTVCPSPKKNYWKTGKVNSAGVFLDIFVRTLPTNCNISAILPDVLRSGSRYVDFRTFIAKNIKGICSVWGRFNSKTDVDVFVLSGILNENTVDGIKWIAEKPSSLSLSSLYDVRIGPLVAYRDPLKGPEYAYFHPKNTPAWEIVTNSNERRQFEGTVLKPPFVLIKRTSSPTDRFRASATVVNLKENVAVENHMMVVTPKSLKLSDCLILLDILKSDATNSFLNERIRLRHLTVSAVKDIPLN
ncbi:MAG TPA: SAM-dependent DNA methyltransferase [Lelliottia sp.]|jgi:hypothetical protein